MSGSVRCLECRKLADDCACRGATRKELRVYTGRDPVTGKKRYKSQTVTAGKREAKAELAKLVEKTAGTGAQTVATLSALMLKWIDHIERQGRGAGTVRNYRQHQRAVNRPLRFILDGAYADGLEAFFEKRGIDDVDLDDQAAARQRLAEVFFAEHPDHDATFVLGDVALDRLTTEDIDAYYRCLMEIDRSANTVGRYHSSIRGALRFGMSRTPAWISHNPALGTTRPSIRKPDLTVPTPEQVRAIVGAAEARSREHGTFLRLAVANWARRGENVALRRSAVNLDIGEIQIATSLSVHQGLKDTKTHGKRRLRIDLGTCRELQDHFDRMDKRAANAGVELAADPFVFSDEADCSRPWHPDTATRFFDHAARTAGVLGVRLHDLRHFGATQAISSRRMPITAISYRLGHSKVTTTLDVYAHWIPSDDFEAADLMGELLDGPSALPEPAALPPAQREADDEAD